MQTEKRLDGDADPIQDYIAMLDRDASRPMPFRKLAALVKIGTLRRRLATAVSRYPDPASSGQAPQPRSRPGRRGGAASRRTSGAASWQ
ncbi:MAG: hypothetical protein IPF53_10525 [Blastocatellia bacterium]|nr:hypothetical protein [Blastocatellia bacterium]